MELSKENKIASVIMKKMIETYKKNKYFLYIYLKSYKNLSSNDILNISPFFEIEVSYLFKNSWLIKKFDQKPLKDPTII